jgi:hypothetical protein
VLTLVAVLPMTAAAASSDFKPESVANVEQRIFQDVRIGNPRVGAHSVDLDFHRGTENLFAAVSWPDGWSLNISTDGGATWQETYFYPSASEVSMRVGGDFAWVSYAPSAAPTQLRMRRFFATTGAPDATYNYQLVGNLNPVTIVDVAMTANADSGDSGIYVACIGSDNAPYFFWDDLVGTSFDPFHPPSTIAEGGLDITMNPGAGSGFFLLMSFQSGSAIKVWRLHIFGGWEQTLSYGVSGSNNYSAISAYQDTVAAVIEMDYTNGNGILSLVNTNAGQGGEWSPDVIYIPPTPTAPEAAGADISLRSPSGSLLTYQLEEGVFDGVYYRQRHGHGQGSWESAVAFNEVDSAAQEQTTVEWLGIGCDGSYGMIYVSGGDFVPYFDLITPWEVFCDAFESGDMSEWSSTVP